MNTTKRILLFDGVCNLCNGIVQFIIKRDPEGKIKFASLQSEIGKKLLIERGLPSKEFDSFVYIKDENYFLKSSAGLHVLKDLDGAWQIFYPLIILPRPLRDFVYDLNARSRYKIFGKRDKCMIPTPDLKERFLE